MRKPQFLLISIGLLFHGLYAQNKLDSVQQIWQNESLQDTVRFKALDNFIWQDYILPNQELEEAFQLVELLYQDAFEKRNPRWAANALNTKGVILVSNNDEEAALAAFKEGLEINKRTGNKEGMATFLNNIGRIYEQQHIYDSARLYYLRSLALQEEIGDQENIGYTLSDIGNVFFRQSKFDTALNYYEQSLEVRESLQDTIGIADALNNIASVYKRQDGNYAKALEFYSRSLALAQQTQNPIGIANALENLGIVYSNVGENAQALDHYERSLSIIEAHNLNDEVPHILNGLGTIYQKKGNINKAVEYYQNALRLARQEKSHADIALSLTNLGMMHELSSELDLALADYTEALKLRKRIEDYWSVPILLNKMAHIFLKQEAYQAAVSHSEEALQLAREGQIAEPQREAAKHLHIAYRSLGQVQNSLNMLELYLLMRDSLDNEDITRKVIDLNYRLEMETKELKIEKQNAELSRQRIALAAAAGCFLLILGLAFSILRGKKRSDELLLNILPAETAQELKTKGVVEAKEFDNVTLLVSDFKDFTRIAAGLSAKELVAEIHYCFQAFDEIMNRFGLEKIKTVGDAYLAVSGLPDPSQGSAQQVIKAALAMQTLIEERKLERQTADLPYFEMRVGIHTGPVVAGVVGVNKFQYDVWGDTVNTASRMETHGEVGKVNISTKTYEAVRDHAEFTFVSRGRMEVKGKGLLEMYFVQSS